MKDSVAPAIKEAQSTSLPYGFWQDLADGKLNHCSEKFVKDLSDELDTSGDESHILMRMYRRIQFETVDDCSDKFLSEARDLMDGLKLSLTDLDGLSKPFHVGFDNDYDDQNIASAVADVMNISPWLVKTPAKDIDLDKFEQIYRRTGPCVPLLKKVIEPKYVAYDGFLRILTDDDYYSKAPKRQQDVAKYLAACRYKQNNDKILRLVFDAYNRKRQ